MLGMWVHTRRRETFNAHEHYNFEVSKLGQANYAVSQSDVVAVLDKNEVNYASVQEVLTVRQVRAALSAVADTNIPVPAGSFDLQPQPYVYDEVHALAEQVLRRIAQQGRVDFRFVGLDYAEKSIDSLQNMYYSFGIFTYDKQHNFSRELAVEAVVMKAGGKLFLRSVALTTDATDTSGVQGSAGVGRDEEPAPFLPPI